MNPLPEELARQGTQTGGVMFCHMEVSARSLVVMTTVEHRDPPCQTCYGLPVIPGYKHRDDPRAFGPANIPDGWLVSSEQERYWSSWAIHGNIKLSRLMATLIDLERQLSAPIRPSRVDAQPPGDRQLAEAASGGPVLRLR